MEKEKNKSPSYAMRISVQINKVAWSMLVDGKAFAEAEINEMVSKYFFYCDKEILLIMSLGHLSFQSFIVFLSDRIGWKENLGLKF